MTRAREPLHDLADAYGVHSDFHDLGGARHAASPDTLRALLAALGVETGSQALIAEELARHSAALDAQIIPSEQVVLSGRSAAVPVRRPCAWRLQTEDGQQIAEGRAKTEVSLPPLQSGYYLLHAGGQSTRLLARPVRAPSLAAQTGREMCWGMTGALYGLRSASNGGLGNYHDLSETCAALGPTGAQFFGINPVHALGWAAGEMISPYSPTHRGYFNADHVATQAGLGPTPDAEFIDYPAFRTAHRAALETEFAAFAHSPERAAFEAWLTEAGPEMASFAQFETLSETYGADCRTWPAPLRAPGAVSAKAAGARAQFHAWLQWRAQTQISAAQTRARASGMSLGLYLDLAVGARPGGGEVWMNAGTIAKGVTIGAPPDHLSPEGQSWALAAHAPTLLAKTYYAPLRAMLRSLMERSGLLRIDHALGLLRSFWIPDDGSPGGYISQPLETLLAIITIEAERTGCVIVGEDLGLVPDGFRAAMAASGLYSYAVWQYEARADGHILPPHELPAQALACFGTHDTPTLQGFWYGTDIAWWQRVGWLGGGAALARHADRAKQRGSLREVCDIGPMATAPAISNAIHSTLATAPSAMLAIQLDDALGLREAQNLPGTIDAHPNWRRRTPVPVEDFAAHADIQNAGAMMPANRRVRAPDDTAD